MDTMVPVLNMPLIAVAVLAVGGIIGANILGALTRGGGGVMGRSVIGIIGGLAMGWCAGNVAQVTNIAGMWSHISAAGENNAPLLGNLITGLIGGGVLGLIGGLLIRSRN